ncbi:serine/threonine-protein kinase [Nocardia asteroides]|uniref:non-specific serine/threonine protein kinase n=1 Tax=Nocardia asteroides NBRC 15531 TaxID=1110697 RepID=U5E5G7_NOCAS|nr:serine/threonine-protein kinase [Nocardia asteroides]UGT46791.1 serine/threonine protein kinase [Nocardia asteroides]GAD81471.1 serine/threonine protein kinase PknB [Nocardia asteroides NBRC 15531]SFN65527.1 Serine/threonine protein kinase [Nocardia asteroides]VEG34357.1 Serine/threonine-protein kinase PrkC [Nocardia asteroides]
MVGLQPQVVGGRYQLTNQIGAGGMGQVFAGYDRHLERPIAVKLTRPDLDTDPQWTQRFIREARLMARLAHPGLPAIHDAGIEPGPPERPYLVMDFVHGASLDQIAGYRSMLPVGVVASIGAQVAAVLAAAHRQSIFHRDLKPSNVMLCPDGTVKVLDFGLAVLLDSDVSRLTSTGNTLGTPAYMAPEQINGDPVVAQTDLYSLGLVLYELLTGAQVITGSTPFLLWRKQIEFVPPEVSTLRRDIPRDVVALLSDMLAKDPRQRPRDASAVHSVLQRHIGGLDDLDDVREPTSPARLYAQALVAPPSYRTARTLIAPPADIAFMEPHSAPTVQGFGDDRRGAADRHFDAGEFAAAAELYRTCAEELTAANGPYDEQAMYCVQRHAICQLRLGNPKAALNRLKRLHQQMSVRFGAQDPRVIELATQIDGIHVR